MGKAGRSRSDPAAPRQRSPAGDDRQDRGAPALRPRPRRGVPGRDGACPTMCRKRGRLECALPAGRSGRSAGGRLPAGPAPGLPRVRPAAGMGDACREALQELRRSSGRPPHGADRRPSERATRPMERTAASRGGRSAPPIRRSVPRSEPSASRGKPSAPGIPRPPCGASLPPLGANRLLHGATRPFRTGLAALSL